MSDLLPCPFCGGTPIRKEDGKIKCSNWKMCSGSNCHHFAWNTRTDQHTEALEAIKVLREELIAAKEKLKKHHDWHSKEIGEIMFPEAKDVIINMSNEYGESALCEETCGTIRTIDQALQQTERWK